ncbi:MAG: hypothetical protein AAF962_23605 [Actinomycetota bacterium]
MTQGRGSAGLVLAVLLFATACGGDGGGEQAGSAASTTAQTEAVVVQSDADQPADEPIEVEPETDPPAPPPAESASFTSVAIDALDAFPHTDQASLLRCRANMMAGGIGVSDLDGDGLLDITIPRLGGGPIIAVNQGDLEFTAVELDHPDPSTFYGAAVAVAQLDGRNGDDLVVSSFGGTSAAVWLDDGDGYTYATELAAPEQAACSTNMSIVAADIDDDGAIDLAIADWSPEGLDVTGTQVWLGDGTGAFELRRQPDGSAWGDNDKAMMAMGVVDVDRDARTDLFFAADWNGTGFETSAAAEIVDAPFTDTNGMGLAITDADRDGDLEFYVSSIGAAPGYPCKIGDLGARVPCLGSRMYEISASGEVVDVTDDYGVADTGWAWGSVFADIDADGSDTLVVSNGMTIPGVMEPPAGDSEVLSRPTGVWLIDLDTGEQSALDGTVDLAGKTVVAADLDRDGDLDIVHMATSAGLGLFENTLDPAADRWVGLVLENWPAADALAVSIVDDDEQLTPVRVMQRGGWFQTHQASEAYFGLDARLAAAIEAGTATVVIDEVGTGVQRCASVDDTGAWLTIDVGALDPC